MPPPTGENNLTPNGARTWPGHRPLLAGTPPFTGAIPQAVMARHTSQVPSPAIILDTISPELEDIIMCALRKRRTPGSARPVISAKHTK